MTEEEFRNASQAINDPRRFELIEKKVYGGGLTDEESVEYTALQEAARKERNAIAPLSTERLDAALEKLRILENIIKSKTP